MNYNDNKCSKVGQIFCAPPSTPGSGTFFGRPRSTSSSHSHTKEVLVKNICTLHFLPKICHSAGKPPGIAGRNESRIFPAGTRSSGEEVVLCRPFVGSGHQALCRTYCTTPGPDDMATLIMELK